MANARKVAEGRSSRSTGSKYTPRSHDEQAESSSSPPPYRMQVSRRFLLASFAGCVFVAFLSGRFVAAMFMMSRRGDGLAAPTTGDAAAGGTGAIIGGDAAGKSNVLRRIVEIDNKQSDISGSSQTCSSDEAGACGALLPQDELHVLEKDDQDSSDDDEDEDDSSDDDEEEEEKGGKDDARGLKESLQFNLPSTGQILRIDFDNVVDPKISSSNDATASFVEPMLDLLAKEETGGWKALSYHCHCISSDTSSAPDADAAIGHYCTGILTSAAHFAVLTSPSTRSVKLTLQTSTKGVEGLERIANKLKDVFAPSTGNTIQDVVNESRIRWSLAYRGWRRPFSAENRDPLLDDLGDHVFSSELISREVVSAESMFQRIDILDIVNPRHVDLDSYGRSLACDDDCYESQNPELFAPNRIVFLDGVMQSTSRGEEAYHEALVHPALFTHPDPARVAIIGGGEGATLREVLKHGTVRHVKMIDIDQLMVELSDEYLPTWNDCSDIDGSHESCFEDERADVLYEDAMAWFLNRFSEASVGTDVEHLYQSEDKFDVIISDLLDPQDTVEFAHILYGSDSFVRSLYHALGDDGILIMQLGPAAALEDPAEEITVNRNRAGLTKMIANIGFKSMHTYEESHAGFNDPWEYLIACKSYSCRERFYASSAQVELSIHKRIRRSRSGQSLLKYFDGATLESYQRPRKATETVHCRSMPKPPECILGTGYSKDRQYFTSAEHLEMRSSVDGSSTSVYAKANIPRGSYIKTAGGSISIPPHASELVSASSSLLKTAAEADSAITLFLDNHGARSKLKGGSEWYVDTTGLTAYMKHGTGTSSNVARLAYQDFSVRNPVLQRRITSYATGYVMALRDIFKGEELIINHSQ